MNICKRSSTPLDPVLFQAQADYEPFNVATGDCLILKSKSYHFGDLVAVRWHRSHYLGLFVMCGSNRYIVQPERVFRLPKSAEVLGAITLLT